MKPMERTGNISRSVVRALTLLNEIGGDSCSVSDLSVKLKLSKGTVHSLLKTMEMYDFIEQDKDSGRYSLGPSILKLASQKMNKSNLIMAATKYLQQFSNEYGETTHLAVPNGLTALILLKIESQTVRYTLKTHSDVGTRLNALHCTSLGKMLIAHLPESEVNEYIAKGLKPYSDKTITDPDVLRAELEATRKRGYSLNLGEFEEGLHSLAVPIRDFRDQLVAIINFTAPAVRMSEEKVVSLYPEFQQVANRIADEILM